MQMRNIEWHHRINGSLATGNKTAGFFKKFTTAQIEMYEVGAESWLCYPQGKKGCEIT